MSDVYQPYPTRNVNNGAAVNGPRRPIQGTGNFDWVIDVEGNEQYADITTLSSAYNTNNRFYSHDPEQYHGTQEYDGATNADVIIYYPAVTHKRHVITGLDWSYSATPTNGAVQIESPSGTIIWKQSITAAGPGFHKFNENEGITGALGDDLVLRMTNGGASVSGNLSAASHRTW